MRRYEEQVGVDLGQTEQPRSRHSLVSAIKVQDFLAESDLHVFFLERLEKHLNLDQVSVDAYICMQRNTKYGSVGYMHDDHQTAYTFYLE